MPPEFLIPEFQELWRPLAPPLTLVNRIWGAGADLLVPALVFWLGGAQRGFRAAWITGLSRCLNTLFKWALAMPALPRRRERWLAVAIGLAANFLWGRAASAIIGGLASFAGGIALAFLLIPLIATLPPVLFLLVPAAAQRLAAWRGGGGVGPRNGSLQGPHLTAER